MRSLARVVILGGWLITAGTASAATPTVTWFSFTPTVLALGEPEDVRFEIQTAGGAEGAVVQLRPGTAGRGRLLLELEPLGSGRFGVTLDYAKVLHDHQPDRDRMHHVVGNLELRQGGQSVGGVYNLVINVSDGTFGMVPLTRRDADMVSSPRVVNIVGTFEDPSRLDLAATLRRFYAQFPDEYDFVNVLTYPESFQNRVHIRVRSAVQGIGIAPFDGGAAYGSGQRLLGLNRFPILSYFDMAELAALHEMGHQWIQFLDLAALRGLRPHWPASSLAYGIMGYQTQLQGLDFTYTVDHIGGEEYRWESAPRARLFTDMDLYLMGLLAPEEVKPHVVPREDREPCHGCSLGPVSIVTADDVIRRYGHRLPDHRTSQKHFRIATIVVSRRPLTVREMSFLDHFAARGEATEPLAYSSGKESGTTLPWFLATGGRSTISTKLD